MASALPLTIAIPTYRREQVLIETLDQLLSLDPPASEIIVVDQTERHDSLTETQLAAWLAQGRIRRIVLDKPSIPVAMNRALLEAREEIVLFVDDDIRPHPTLLSAHLAAHRSHPGVLVAGRVIQPWDLGRPAESLGGFASTSPAWLEEFIGCNFSVAGADALAVGGFDENFIRVAYRFEAEFAHRFRRAGHRIRFEPAAALDHVKATDGGTRTFGVHTQTIRPDHAVGAYYSVLRTWSGPLDAGRFIGRLPRSVATRFHLRHPWWIPVTLIAELWAMGCALALSRRPRYAAPANATQRSRRRPASTPASS